MNCIFLWCLAHFAILGTQMTGHYGTEVSISRNLSNPGTNGAEESVLIILIFQRLTARVVLGVGKSVLFREVLSVQL